MGEGGEVGKDQGRIGAGVVLRPQAGEGGGHVAAHHGGEEVDHLSPVGEAEHLAYGLGGDGTRAMRDRLVEERQRIAHRALGGARDRRERLRLDLDLLLAADAREVPDELLGVDASEIEALAARQNRHRNLANLSRGENELRVRRRFFERLQEGVEGARREHVDLVHDVDLVAGRHRRITHRFVELPDIVDAVVGGGVDLHHVDMAAVDDRLAMDAELRHADGRPALCLGGAGQLIVQAARKDPGSRGLADAAHAGEHPGLRDAAGLEGIREGAHHGVLADQVVEGAGAVLAGEHAVGRARRRRRRKARQGRLVGKKRAGRLVHRHEGGERCAPRQPRRSAVKTL
jgi:hypothetical protein